MADWKRTPYSPGLGSPPSGAAGTVLGDHMLHGQFCARDDATNTIMDRTAREQIEGNILRISDSLNTTWGCLRKIGGLAGLGDEEQREDLRIRPQQGSRRAPTR